MGLNQKTVEAKARPLPPLREAPPASAPARERSQATFTVSGPEALARLEPHMADLARHAVERNPFYAPWMIGPALRHLGARNVKCVCFWDGEAPGGTLIGFLPIVRAFGYARVPAPHLASWRHDHCYYSAPLFREGFEAAFLDALFAFVDAAAPRFGFLRLDRLDPDAPAARLILGAATGGERFIYAAGEFKRAILRGGHEPEDLINANIRKKKLKDLIRLRKRLSEQGPLTLRVLGPGDDLSEWREMFMALEGEGWKGSGGTSFNADSAQSRFLEETLDGARASGVLQFFRLESAKKTIAMLINFSDRGQGYGFKICHSEAFARYSPGVLAEIEMTKALGGMAAGDFVDSCATPDHPMINSIWRDRRRITGVNISRASAASSAALRFCKFLEDLQSVRKAP